MKRYFVSMSAALLALWMLSSCATTEERAARRAEQARMVTASLNERHYKISVDQMHPTRGTSRHVSYGYSVEVRNDSLISYLPYFGRAYDIPYGGGKGLNFSDSIVGYHEYEGKKGMRLIEIGVVNDEDKYLYTIKVFENGSASVDVMAQKREPISYSGTMTFE